MIEIKIKFFGIFEELFGTEINITIEENTKLSDLKKILFNKINNINFLNDTFEKSLFSNEETILSDNYILKEKQILYLLPPFSGG